jgi:hypothetical protein
MPDLSSSPSMDPSFKGYYRFNNTRFGIFYQLDNEHEFLVHEMFLKTKVFDEAVEKIDAITAGVFKI